MVAKEERTKQSGTAWYPQILCALIAVPYSSLQTTTGTQRVSTLLFYVIDVLGTRQSQTQSFKQRAYTYRDASEAYCSMEAELSVETNLQARALQLDSTYVSFESHRSTS